MSTDELSQIRHIDPSEVGEQLGDLIAADFECFSQRVERPHDLVVAILEEHGWDPSAGDGLDLEGLWVHRSTDATARTVDDYIVELETAVNRYGHALQLDQSIPVVGERGETGEAYDGVVELLQVCRRVIPAGTEFWRARVGEHHTVDQIESPPPGRIGAGRANVSGERVIYLADSVETALAEVRPSLSEEVSVGAFRASRRMEVCYLITSDDTASPFDDLARYNRLISQRQAIHYLGGAFGAPLRRSDSQEGYIYTQYIALVCRRLGYDGIQFRSSQTNGHGENTVLFDPFGAPPTGVIRHFRVGGIRYSADEYEAPAPASGNGT